MRDITRGGLATVICDLVDSKDFGAKIMEEDIPVRESVETACDMLGYDPLYLANEGKVLMIVDRKEADKVMQILRHDSLGHDAAVIGELTGSNPGEAVLFTGIGGGSRLLHPLRGVQLPRIC
jgi:hydrogenase expression/formation protein HypE